MAWKASRGGQSWARRVTGEVTELAEEKDRDANVSGRLLVPILRPSIQYLAATPIQVCRG